MPTQKQLDKACGRLYKAVANYVETRGGSVLVAGGVQLQEWDDRKMNFYIAVKCTGRKPVMDKPKEKR